MRLGVCRVRSCTFGGFLCALRVVRFVRVLSARSRAPFGSLGAFSPFPCDLLVLEFVRVGSVHSRARWGSSCSFVYVWSIPVRPTGRRVSSGSFGPFPCALWVIECVLSFPVRAGGLRLRSVPFACAMGVVECLGYIPWGSSGSLWCVRPICVRPWSRRVRWVNSHAPWWSSGLLVCVRSIPVRPEFR